MIPSPAWFMDPEIHEPQKPKKIPKSPTQKTRSRCQPFGRKVSKLQLLVSNVKFGAKRYAYIGLYLGKII